tara:strand:- start:1741 stop:1956 length:216 start_codon:yes stop_codon:yes gene_type:complete
MATIKMHGKNFKTAALCSNDCCCVAVRQENNEVLVADTKNPEAKPLRFNQEEWQTFIKAAKAGEFDMDFSK